MCAYKRTSERPRVDKRPDQRPRVNVRPCIVKHKREGNTEAHKVIGGKQQSNYVTKGDVSSPMVLEEAQMPKYVTNTQEQREVAVATIPSKCVQRVTSKCSKIYLSSATEGCNEERIIAVRSEAMRPCYVQQVTQQLQSQEMEWR